jgi:uncharacterized phage protein (TIGR01671 family)
MREIKFRAWDEGNRVLHKDVEFIRSGIEDNDWIIFKSDKQKLENDAVFDNPYFQKQIKLMQYTGLKDKNGVEIYEGDIVKGTIFGIAFVKYEHNSFVLWNKGSYSRDYRNYVHENIEVIGNIYENYELLEEEQTND